MDKQGLLCAQVLSALAGHEVPLPDDVLDHVCLVSLGKGQSLFEMGQTHPFVYVIRAGCLKTVYRQPCGEEWVQDFLAEGAFFGSVAALSGSGVCSYSCEAVEACQLERIDYAWIEQVAQHHPLWRLALLNGWKDYATRKEWRERDLLTLNPQQRYAAFVRQDPALAERVPQKELARYLGITPVSLSRIRRRLSAA
jgi:CRP-like cAMP-binding protein